MATSSIETETALPHTWSLPIRTLAYIQLGGGAATTQVWRRTAVHALTNMDPLSRLAETPSARPHQNRFVSGERQGECATD